MYSNKEMYNQLKVADTLMAMNMEMATVATIQVECVYEQLEKSRCKLKYISVTKKTSKWLKCVP